MSLGITERKVTNPKGNRANLTGMGKGRPVGALNVINRDIKEMILGALNDVGGRAYLARQAERNPNAFMALVGRVLPLQVAGHDGGAFTISLGPITAATSAIASPTAPQIEGALVRDAVEVGDVEADDPVVLADQGEGASVA